MRYLRIAAIVILVLSLVFTGWVQNRYSRNINTDRPVLQSTVQQLDISVKDPKEAIFQGLTATDATDGDLTDQIMVASVSHFLEPGTVNVKYVVFDDHNNSATLTRRVHYTDYTPPVFSLEKDPGYVVGRSFDLLEHVQVTDVIDGDISDRIRIVSNMVNNYSVGNYPVVLEVTNSCGDAAQLTVWVKYKSTEDTVDIDLHSYIVYIPQGEAFEPRTMIASAYDKNKNALDSEKVEILGNLDVNTPGTYQLTYSYQDSKVSGQSTLTVVVTERQD